MIASNQIEQRLFQAGYQRIAGLDEAGRGPLAGPVVAAAVILNPDVPISGLHDSKQLSHKKRLMLATLIKQHAIAFSIVFVNEAVIDQINIYQASKKAMLEAISQLPIQPDYLLSDAMPLKESHLPFEALIHGDALSISIAAASILAKTARDEYMVECAKLYPEYGFEQHKGYPTKAHVEAIHRHGVLPIHRKSYQPVKDCLNQQMTLFGEKR